jgi:thiol:disulfide interchange protein DsbD
MKHISTWLVVLGLLLVGRAQAAMTDAGHVQLELVPAAASIAPGQTVYVALHEKIRAGWHTYWRNPGDAGEPPRLGWTLPTGWKAGDIVWPAPKRLPVGPLMDYGYEGEVWLPVPVTAPKAAPAGKPATLKAAVSILVCQNVCVPEDATLQLDLPVAAQSAPASSAGIAEALAAAPHGPPLQAAMSYKAGLVKLAVLGAALHGPAVRDAYFYPFSSSVIDQPKPQTVVRGPRGLTLTLQPGYAFKTGPAPKVLDGLLEVDGRPFEVQARQGPLPAAAAGLGPVAAADDSGFAGGQGIAGLALAAGAAFLGGIVLNLMPCVFPILSMKAASLIARPHEAGAARAQGIAFLIGVLGAFLALAGVIIALRGAGQAVGWGAQLQPAVVTAGLALVLLAAALDLSGVFEIGASLQGLGGGLASRADLLGAVFTGALAVVVAAPCTAPFMGPALGYALTQPALPALAIFTALALGFAAPFTLLAFSPALLRRLPKPGPWMDVLKKVLAFPMYAAAAWLLWVLAAQTDRGSLAAAFAAAVLVGLAAWIFGAAQRRSATGKRAGTVFALAGVSAALAVAAVAAAPYDAPPSSGNVAVAAGIPSEPWSPERVASLRAEGKPVFVDFTAAWCVTCQVNEQTALNTGEAVKAFQRTGAVYLKADWTNRDNAIAKALADQGRVGVPLYLVYGKDGGAPQVLPQLLTSGLVSAALDAAARSPHP